MMRRYFIQRAFPTIIASPFPDIMQIIMHEKSQLFLYIETTKQTVLADISPRNTKIHSAAPNSILNTITKFICQRNTRRRVK